LGRRRRAKALDHVRLAQVDLWAEEFEHGTRRDADGPLARIEGWRHFGNVQRSDDARCGEHAHRLDELLRAQTVSDDRSGAWRCSTVDHVDVEAYVDTISPMRRDLDCAVHDVRDAFAVDVRRSPQCAATATQPVDLFAWRVA